MNNAPILVFQMQRMGDLVLSFPLLGWLAGVFPGHPLWVVGERLFFDPLMPLSPPATYFSYGEAPDFQRVRFHLVINLSHRPEAAILAGQMRGDALVGPYQDDRGRLRIEGDWQLYRASLTHNNRYNLFHWADLNALDVIPARNMLRTAWPLPRPLPGRQPNPPGESRHPPAINREVRIGLFLGASEAEKHPDARFWVSLAKRLLQSGYTLALLGGEAEAPLGSAVAGALGIHGLNLCGRFSVSALAQFVAELDLFVTPDTGPMHVAAWTGTPVLNLSLGPVNPWETGPFSPGHHVVRAGLGCTGCWRCLREKAVCKEEMTAGKIAVLIEAMLSGPGGIPASLGSLTRGLELLRTHRGRYGLYGLKTVFHAPPVRKGETGPDAGGNSPAVDSANSGTEEGHEARKAVSLFWQAWFGARFGRFTGQEDNAAWIGLREEHPDVARRIRDSAAELAVALARTARANIPDLQGESVFWQRTPPTLHPLSGYVQMYIQNDLGSRASLLHALSLLEQIAAQPL